MAYNKIIAITLALLLSDTLADGPGKGSKCRVGWTYFDGSCYAFVDMYRTWHGAGDFCLLYGSYLVEIESVQENTWLTSKLISSGFGSVWLGGSEELHRGTYLWADSGNPLIFSDWSFMQPLDLPGVTEDCLEMRDQYYYKWNDFDCNQFNKFICEMRIQPLED